MHAKIWLPTPVPSQKGFAYFLFDGRSNQADFQLYNKFLRSLIAQLSDTRHGGMSERVADLYNKWGEAQQPSDNDLEDTLRDIMQQFSDTYIIIDALDECTERGLMLQWLNRLLTDTDGNQRLHVLVTSRPLPDITKEFLGLNAQSTDVSESNENHDIAKYLERYMPLKFGKFSESIQDQIELTLKTGAEGS